MYLNVISENKKEVKKDYYKLTVETMTGDADDFHEIDFTFENDTKSLKHLRKLIIACEVLGKHHKDGMSGSDDYNACPYWNNWFNEDESEIPDNVSMSDDWYYDCNTGNCDQFDGYSLKYYDLEGNEHSVEIKMDDEMIQEINDAKVLK